MPCYSLNHATPVPHVMKGDKLYDSRSLCRGDWKMHVVLESYRCTFQSPLCWYIKLENGAEFMYEDDTVLECYKRIII